MTRTNQVLTIALIAQIILSIFAFMPGDKVKSSQGEPLLDAFTPDEVVRLTITDDQDKQIVLAKNEQDEWVLPELDDFPAQSFRVNQLLGKFEAMNRARLIAVNSANHKKLGVSDSGFEKRVEIEQSGGGTATLYLGTSSGSSTAHVRLSGEDQVYLVRGLAAWEVPTRVTSWVDTTYFSVPRDNILALRVENANGVFELAKVDGSWKLVGLQEGETFDPESVTPLLNKISSIRLSDVFGKEADESWDMDNPQAVVTLTVREEVTSQADETGDESTEDTAEVTSLDDLVPDTESDVQGDSGQQLTGSQGEEAAQTEEPTGDQPQFVEKTITIRIGKMLEDSGYPVISSESEYYVRVASATVKAFVDLTREEFLKVPENDAAESGTPSTEPGS